MKATRICSVLDCARPAKSRGWCNTHYERWRLRGTVDLPLRPTACGVTNCHRGGRLIRGWCKYHWQRWARHGDPLAGGPTRRQTTDSCAVEGCTGPDVALGWCKAHHYRWSRYGDPTAGADPSPRQRSTTWVPGYGAAHWRLQHLRGSAAAHPCADCGAPAEHWSYDHSDPDELVESHGVNAGLRYSLDVGRYDARCVSCHRKFDLAA